MLSITSKPYVYAINKLKNHANISIFKAIKKHDYQITSNFVSYEEVPNKKMKNLNTWKNITTNWDPHKKFKTKLWSFWRIFLRRNQCLYAKFLLIWILLMLHLRIRKNQYFKKYILETKFKVSFKIYFLSFSFH